MYLIFDILKPMLSTVIGKKVAKIGFKQERKKFPNPFSSLLFT